MRKIESSEILDLTEYEKVRPSYLPRMIAAKRPRRVHVGEILCFVFENRDTVLFQIQEMTRAERSVTPEAIAAEVDVYNELIPPEHGLSATLMIEIPSNESIRSELDRLIGIDEHVHLDIGGDTVQASFDAKQFQEDRVAAVQYIRFELGPELATRFRNPAVAVELRVDHPNYAGKTPIVGETRASLAADLG